MTDFFAAHRETLEKAVAAFRGRGYWSPYSEAPSGKIYGETAATDGETAFKARLNKPFVLDLPGVTGHAGAERSPYGFDLGVTYPAASADTLLQAARLALPAWRDAGPDTRAGVCLEILRRLNHRSFEVAHAVMHTTGQAFMMAFQAGGAHAQDRGLEAVAYAWDAMKTVPATARWEKPQGKNPALVMEKTFRIIPRGVALLVGCSTFPTWNGYPGLFASLATGNPVIIKPHRSVTLPHALTVETARAVLQEAGFDPNLVTLWVNTAGHAATQDLARHPDVRLIDFTGSTEFGDWLERNASQARVYTEKAGVNTVVIDDFDDLKGLIRNLSFTLSLYSGQMCTTPQNIYVPRNGIMVGGERIGFDALAQALAEGVTKLLSVPERAVEILGAIQSDAILQRLEEARRLGPVVLESASIAHPTFPEATVRTPLLVKLDAVKDEASYTREVFGPVAFVIAVDDVHHGLRRMRDTIRAHGALTASVYSNHAQTLREAEIAAADAGVALSCNLTGGVFVNQSAAFSDFHGTGANPAANAALTDHNFVTGRFCVAQTRHMVS